MPVSTALLGRRADRGLRRALAGARAAALEGVAERPRDAPVEDVDLAEVAEHDVRRLEIAVHDAAAVRELDREADVDERAQHAPPHRGLVLGADAGAQQVE